jgi:predicted HTH domain antitoxin
LAVNLGLPVIGTLRVLLIAKQKGQLASIRPLLKPHGIAELHFDRTLEEPGRKAYFCAAMNTVTIELEEPLVSILRQENHSVATVVREMIVTELYRRGVVSDGKAAELLGTSREEFVRRASSVGIPTSDSQGAERAVSEEATAQSKGEEDERVERIIASLDPAAPRRDEMAALIRQHFNPETKAERVARSLAALNEPSSIQLTPEEWRWIAEDPDLEDQF